MFNNARTYNQEGSWVYQDADEMEKVFDAAWTKFIVGSGLPGAPPASGPSSSAGYDGALSPMDEDERRPVSKGQRARKTVISDDEYLTPTDDE